VNIDIDDLSGPEIANFLDEHIAQMRAITPLESKHALDLEGLREPGVTLWSVKDGPSVVGCGALKALNHSHAEIKSMRTAPTHLHQGVASALLQRMMAEGRRMGYGRLSLETGSGELFLPARRLYAKHGFEYCGPFADYAEDPNSVFMTREL
jgi:putative acetyltransferase